MKKPTLKDVATYLEKPYNTVRQWDKKHKILLIKGLMKLNEDKTKALQDVKKNSNKPML